MFVKEEIVVVTLVSYAFQPLQVVNSIKLYGSVNYGFVVTAKF